MDLLKIENNGPDIVSTNYWQSDYAANGYVYLTINSGAFRLLVPDQMDMEDMLTAKEIIISRGPWPNGNKPDALELLFEDFSDSPFCLHIGAEQIDRMPTNEDAGKTFPFVIWTSSGKVKEFVCRYRTVPKIPYLKPWQ
jgi:hypothetical protein